MPICGLEGAQSRAINLAVTNGVIDQEIVFPESGMWEIREDMINEDLGVVKFAVKRLKIKIWEQG
jgi:hypothetical protein